MIFRDIQDKEQVEKPFRYFLGTKAFEQDFSENLLGWFEGNAPWQLIEAEFYEQYEFSLLHERLPEEFNILTSVESLSWLRDCVEKSFGVKLLERVDVTVHKLVVGQTIRVHNDYIPGEETHRVLIQLNRGWSDSNGGLLIFFNSTDPADINRALRPEHNSCVGFEISPNSNHAVSTIYSGQRFTLVYSFFGSTRAVA